MAGRFPRVQIPDDVQWSTPQDYWQDYLQDCRKCGTPGIRGDGTGYTRRTNGKPLAYVWYGFVCPKCRTITAGGVTNYLSHKQLAFILLAAD